MQDYYNIPLLRPFRTFGILDMNRIKQQRGFNTDLAINGLIATVHTILNHQLENGHKALAQAYIMGITEILKNTGTSFRAEGGKEEMEYSVRQRGWDVVWGRDDSTLIRVIVCERGRLGAAEMEEREGLGEMGEMFVGQRRMSMMMQEDDKIPRTGCCGIVTDGRVWVLTHWMRSAAGPTRSMSPRQHRGGYFKVQSATFITAWRTTRTRQHNEGGAGEARAENGWHEQQHQQQRQITEHLGRILWLVYGVMEARLEEEAEEKKKKRKKKEEDEVVVKDRACGPCGHGGRDQILETCSQSAAPDNM